jgi:tRNA(Ile)-lysidine synthase
MQRGTLRAAIHRLRGNLRDVNWVHIEDARRIALEKNASAEATLPNGLMLIVGYDDFIIADAKRAAPLLHLPLLRVDEISVSMAGITALPESDWVIEARIANQKPVESTDRWSATFDLEACRGPLRLRHRRAGDRFQPAGMHGHTRSLHEYMIDEKIPRAVRDLLPLLVVNDRIAWVCGWRKDERAHVTEHTRQFLSVTFRKK